MNQSEDVCCFCLNSSNVPFINLFTKSEDGLTQFDKITSSFSQLANILNENAGYNYILCFECCNTINTVCQFNKKCLDSLQTYLSNKKTVKKNNACNKDNQINIESNVNTIQIHNELQIKIETPEEDYETLIDTLHLPKEYTDFSNISDPITEAVYIKEEINDEEPLPEVVEENSPMLLKLLMQKDRRQEFGESSKQINETEFRCKLCDRKYSCKNNLDRHLRSHIDFKPHKCNICGKSFGRRDYLTIHLSVHSTEKPYNCDACDKSFKNKSVLRKHKLVHREDKPHCCDQCDKRFLNCTYLTLHKRIHSGEKPYKCEVCGKKFASKSNLNTHKRFHTGEKPFSCNVCKMSFAYRSNFITHKRNAHKRK